MMVASFTTRQVVFILVFGVVAVGMTSTFACADQPTRGFVKQICIDCHGPDLQEDLSISGIRNEFSVITDFAQYDIRVNPNNDNELFLPNAEYAGNLLFREKLPTAQGTCFPRPNQFHAHGYVNEMADAVDSALSDDRHPHSGALMAWDDVGTHF